MKGFALIAAALLAAACGAVKVGLFDNSRLYNSNLNIATGGKMSMFRADWEDLGASWSQTGTITTSFLNTVTVFITSMVNSTKMTSSEQAALANWVKAGGTLIATGESSAYANEQAAFNSIISPFGMSISGSTGFGMGTVLVDHPLVHSITTLYVNDGGFISAPFPAKSLIQGPSTSIVASVMESGPSVGLGRVLVISDKDMITDDYILYDDNEQFGIDWERWATGLVQRVSGHVTLELFKGSPLGIPLTLTTSDEFGVSEVLYTTLDANGNYSVPFLYGGIWKVVAKASHWLSVKQVDVDMTGSVTLDWDMLYNGDADGDNKVNLKDLSTVLANYNTTGPDGDLDGNGAVNLPDLSIILADYNLVGDT